MNENVLTIDIAGVKADLPVLPLPSGVKIAFFNLHGDTLTLKLSNSSVWGGTSTFHTVTYKGSNSSHMLLDKADTVTCKLSNSSILSIKDVSRVSGKLSNSAKLVVPKKADCSTIETSNSAGIYYQ